ncbi:YycH family regulatory protein [Virgibacillus siamensis]|uniref:YycH family regulatory protein n=1 Tax=Virgibacillus siamensis TaxID=480071 RepID=UPI00098696E2|nr:two-component system activity regulator YycH [Virgibacillus siamensis]
MNLETVKSFILWILVLLSLVLTFSLWNYQPNFEDSKNNKYVDQVNIGGKKQTKQEIIEPKSIIFHNGKTYYGFSDPNEQQSLYQDMQSWVLNNVQTSNQQGVPNEEKQLEIIFPVSLPMQTAKSLFTFSEEKFLPEWSFKKIYITFNRDDSVLNVIFVSDNGEQRVTAVVNNSKKYDLLWRYLTTFEGLKEYKLVKSGSNPYYVPKHQITMSRKVLTINTIDPLKFRNALFAKPEIVSRNQNHQNEVYFTDGVRGLRVIEDMKLMKFDNPYESSERPLPDEELITRSLQSINDRKGWTDEYNLMRIDSKGNEIRYQMYYNGYPIYSNAGLSMIRQIWQPTELSVDLNNYERPLFRLNDLINEKEITLKSVDEVLSYMESKSSYKLEEISDLQVGYHLSYQDIDSNNVVKLQPAWFVEYNGDWKQIEFHESTQHREGGAEDAMETN